MEKLNELIVKFCPAFVLSCWLDVKNLFGLMLILLIFDNITAIWEAFKFRKDKKWFQYHKLKTTIDKFIGYGMALIVGWVLERIMGKDFGLTTFVAGYIAIYEGISVFSHLSKITGLQLFADVIDWLKQKIDFKRYFNNEKNEKHTTDKEF